MGRGPSASTPCGLEEVLPHAEAAVGGCGSQVAATSSPTTADASLAAPAEASAAAVAASAAAAVAAAAAPPPPPTEAPVAGPSTAAAASADHSDAASSSLWPSAVAAAFAGPSASSSSSSAWPRGAAAAFAGPSASSSSSSAWPNSAAVAVAGPSSSAAAASAGPGGPSSAGEARGTKRPAAQPQPSDFVVVYVRELKRSPESLREALRQSPELDELRRSISSSGHEMEHDEGHGPKVLVQPEHWQRIIDKLSSEGVMLFDSDGHPGPVGLGHKVLFQHMKPRHIIVEETFNNVVWNAIENWPGSGMSGGKSNKVKSRREGNFDIEVPMPHVQPPEPAPMVIHSSDDEVASIDVESPGEGDGDGEGDEEGGPAHPDQGQRTDEVAGSASAFAALPPLPPWRRPRVSFVVRSGFISVQVPTSTSTSGPAPSSQLTVSEPGPGIGGPQTRFKKRMRFGPSVSQPQSQTQSQSQSWPDSSGSQSLPSVGQMTLSSQGEIENVIASLPPPHSHEMGSDGVDGSDPAGT
mmetsp:Transcript_113391/g.360492  ORF Transcript_113391/g.360492 Transcript_113391/m.360492 type:complete len:524 (-) Transcript_113391:150-1721(-)